MKEIERWDRANEPTSLNSSQPGVAHPQGIAPSPEHSVLALQSYALPEAMANAQTVAKEKPGWLPSTP